MKFKKIKKLNAGLYNVYWQSGGSSLCSIGITSSGGRWIAPVNWVGTGLIGKSLAKAIKSIVQITPKDPKIPTLEVMADEYGRANGYFKTNGLLYAESLSIGTNVGGYEELFDAYKREVELKFSIDQKNIKIVVGDDDEQS